MAQSITDLRKDAVVKIGEEPYVIIHNSFMKTAQRKPVMRTKMRNLITGKVLEKTFIAGENFELATVEKTNAQYLYKDSDNAYFMDNETFDQFPLSLETIGDQIDFVKEGNITVITKFEGNPISIELPAKVTLKIIDTPPGVKGDTAQGGTKPATLETGAVIQVPLFISEGDSIRVNTETHEYAERA